MTSLAAVTAAANGANLRSGRDRALHSMQVILGDLADATDVDVVLEASHDNGTTYGTIAEWKKSDGRASGDFVNVSEMPVDWIRARCVSITGGTLGRTTVTAILMAADE